MNNEELNLKEILEWYIDAGVDETLDDVPFGLNLETSVVKKTEVKTPTVLRQATTGLAQATIDALKVARDLCEDANSVDELKQMVESFEGCALKLTASKTVFGGGNPQSKIMVIGEAPGADEDRIGLPFVGRSGKLLDKMLSAIGLNRDDVYITNILPWRPPGNRTPTEGEVAVCLPFLKKQIDLIQPDTIVVLGGSAANALLDNPEPISKLRGRWLEYKDGKGRQVDVMASFHPAYLLRNSGQKSKAWMDFLRLKKKIIQ